MKKIIRLIPVEKELHIIKSNLPALVSFEYLSVMDPESQVLVMDGTFSHCEAIELIRMDTMHSTILVHESIPNVNGTCRIQLVKASQHMTELSQMQFRLLAFFMHNAGRVLTREQILESGLGDEGELLDRTIDSHIRRLRKRIEPDPKQPRYIKTVFGIGYQFTKS